MRAYAWAAASAVGFALMNFCAHVAGAQVGWAMTAAVRSIIGAGIAYGVARARGAATGVSDRRGIWQRSIAGTAAMLLTFLALASPLPLGDAVTLLNLAPVFVAFFAPVLIRERTDRRVFLALPPSMAGVGLIVRPELVHGAGAMRGALAAVAAALCSTYSYATLRRIGPRESPEAIALHFSLTAAVVLSTIGAAHATVPDRASLLWMLGAGLTGGLSQIALTRAYSLGRAARVSAIAYLTVVVSALLGAVALEERPTRRAVAGMMLVVAGGLVVTLRRRSAE
jgi:drug/metabolite transporter (DMT)-like permease